MVDAYLICATPRTGSSVLCGLLESTGIAGRPQAYFRQPDEQAWADLWELRDGFDYGDFVRAAVAAGSTANGVFGAKLMWGTLDEVVAKLAPVCPELAGDDLALLRRLFGDLRFVHLCRDDVVAQAVSWQRAGLSTVWFVDDPALPNSAGAIRGERPPARPLRYDFDQIHGWVRTIEEHNAAWRNWFAAVGIEPYELRYEDLAADLTVAVTGVLDFLGLRLPAGRTLAARQLRQTDALNAEWIARYHKWTAAPDT